MKCARCSTEGPLPITLTFPAPDQVGPYMPAQARCCSLRCARDTAQALEQGQAPVLCAAPSSVRTVERDGTGAITRIIDTPQS